MFVVFVLLVVAVRVILGVKVLGDTGITGCKCNAYCPYLLYPSCCWFQFLNNGCVGIYDNDG